MLGSEAIIPDSRNRTDETRGGKYRVGTIIGWALGRTTGEAFFIGNLAADPEHRILVLASASQVGLEIEARDCRMIGPGNPIIGTEYRQRYARQRPGRLRNL